MYQPSRDAIRLELDAAGAYDAAIATADGFGASDSVRRVLAAARDAPARDYVSQHGWVLIAIQNAFFQLLHAAGLEDGLIATVNAGGDADANGCIAGAPLGAVHGADSIPPRWSVTVLGCRTGRGAEYQTADLMDLADALAGAGAVGPNLDR